MKKARSSRNRFLSFLGDRFASPTKKGVQLLDALLLQDASKAEPLISRGASLSTVDSLGRTALHLAAATRSKLVKLLVSKGADVNAKDERGLTPLLEVLTRWNYPNAYVNLYLDRSDAIAEELIGAGADVHATDKEGRTPLHHALAHGRVRVAQLLVNRGADVNRKDNDGEAALHYALQPSAHISDSSFYRLLIDKGADVNLPDQHGNTPLHLALSNGWSGTAELFMRMGATVNPGDPNNGMDLVYAAKLGSLEIARLLVAKGGPVDTKDGGGATALGWALQGGHRKIAALLIDSGADVNAPFATKDSYTHHIFTNNVFHVAVGKGDTELVKAMLEKGAEVDARDRGMFTPLIRAAQANNPELVALLLSRSADVHARDDRGRSALEVTTDVAVADLLLQPGAARYGRDADGATPLFRISDEQIGYAGHLIRSSVDINARDNSGNTALILQALFLHTRMVRFLLDNGAEIEASNEYGTTALISSIDKPSDGETALLLIERGADPNHGNTAGHTPLRGAALFGMERVVGALLNHGADPNVADEVGLTPLMWASRYEHRGIVRLLLMNGAAPNARDTLGRLALHWALECQQGTMLTLPRVTERVVGTGIVGLCRMKVFDF